MCISLILCFMIPHVTITKTLLRARVSTRSSMGEGFNFKLIYMVIGRNNCCSTEGLSSFLTIDQKQPPVPGHVGLFTAAIYFIKAAKREKTQKIKSCSKNGACHVKNWRKREVGNLIKETPWITVS